ncbi:hypothetical protein M446_6184 [Methylobacterium sp. 4-46]|uniref:hypothetical protein n=1 Tax=unclassified Methylobacterium TaxID=2615210 RepID=UPI000165CDEB|nr:MULTISPECIES: hypothetical protein [Methylobacterium]ACA20452.1 hypothetical protein M446_6184 [Methylobacterium sp. 4-46]WFT79622.1 hypothetical protein QA634_31210 [Methylobacterium nodulans]
MRFSLLACACLVAVSTVPACAQDGAVTVFPPLSRMMVRQARIERPAAELTTTPQPVAPAREPGQRVAQAR